MSGSAITAKRLIQLLDLTNLAEDAGPADIDRLCAAADTAVGCVAAVCVYPEYVLHARELLARRGMDTVRVATVVNFPDGSTDLARVARETRRALAAGADEIDAVLPYQALIAGDEAACAAMVEACRTECGERTLKIILESGRLHQPDIIRRGSEIAIAGGADFIKTSTGKVEVNATLAAAETMLTAIREAGGRCGFKAAGGIRRVSDAAAYLALADRILGPDWATPDTFRIGASALLDDALRVVGRATGRPGDAY